MHECSCGICAIHVTRRRAANAGTPKHRYIRNVNQTGNQYCAFSNPPASLRRDCANPPACARHSTQASTRANSWQRKHPQHGAVEHVCTTATAQIVSQAPTRRNHSHTRCSARRGRWFELNVPNLQTNGRCASMSRYTRALPSPPPAVAAAELWPCEADVARACSFFAPSGMMLHPRGYSRGAA